MTKLKMAGAAALIAGVLTCVATGMAAIKTAPGGGPDNVSVVFDHNGASYGVTGVSVNGQEPRKALADDSDALRSMVVCCNRTGNRRRGLPCTRSCPAPSKSLKRTSRQKRIPTAGSVSAWPRARSTRHLRWGPSPRSPFWPRLRASGLIGLPFPNRLTRSYCCNWLKITYRSRAASSIFRASPSWVPRFARPDQGRGSRGHRSLSQRHSRRPDAGVQSQLCEGLLDRSARRGGEHHDRRRRPVPPDRDRPRSDRRHRGRGPDVQSATITAMTRAAAPVLLRREPLTARRSTAQRLTISSPQAEH